MAENPPGRDVDDEPVDDGRLWAGRDAEFLGDHGQQPGLMIDAVTPGGEDLARSGGPGSDHEFAVAARSQWQLVLRRFRQHKLAVISLFVLLLVVLFAFAGPPVWHYQPNAFTDDFSVPPSLKHPFRTG